MPRSSGNQPHRDLGLCVRQQKSTVRGTATGLTCPPPRRMAPSWDTALNAKQCNVLSTES